MITNLRMQFGCNFLRHYLVAGPGPPQPPQHRVRVDVERHAEHEGGQAEGGEGGVAGLGAGGGDGEGLQHAVTQREHEGGGGSQHGEWVA